jgi:uncharacterized protein (TIGR02001 family)
MKKAFSLRAVTAAVVLASSVAALPGVAQAEVSSDLTISSMYLWRGLDISDGKPALSSSINYNHDSGFYVGTWFSSEGMTDSSGAGGTNGNSYEVDAYLGYAKSFGDFGIDVGYAMYMYPQAAGSIGDSDIAEYIVGASWKDLSVKAFINAEPNDFADYTYVSVDYSYDKFGFHYGMTDVSTTGGDYSDFNVSYAATDALTWTISKADGDAIAADSGQDDPIVMVSYSVPLK